MMISTQVARFSANRAFMVLYLFVFLFTAGVSAKPSDSEPEKIVNRAKVAIIIDDLGYSLENGIKALELDVPVTVAIIPHTPHGKSLAALAKSHNREFILHAPMESSVEHRIEQGLMSGMNKAEIDRLLAEMLIDIPGARGINNHGGSAFSKDPISAKWLLESVKKRNLYFIDSRTTAESRFKQAALINDVDFGERDVFLDNDKSLLKIKNQLNKLINYAQKHGYSVGIGHAYPETLTVLEKYLPKYRDQGVEFVFASALVTNLNGEN